MYNGATARRVGMQTRKHHCISVQIAGGGGGSGMGVGVVARCIRLPTLFFHARRVAARCIRLPTLFFHARGATTGGHPQFASSRTKLPLAHPSPSTRRWPVAHTCRAHVAGPSPTCRGHVAHLSRTRVAHMSQACRPPVAHMSRTHVAHMSPACSRPVAHTCRTHVAHLSRTCRAHVWQVAGGFLGLAGPRERSTAKSGGQSVKSLQIAHLISGLLCDARGRAGILLVATPLPPAGSVVP